MKPVQLRIFSCLSSSVQVNWTLVLELIVFNECSCLTGHEAFLTVKFKSQCWVGRNQGEIQRNLDVDDLFLLLD